MPALARAGLDAHQFAATSPARRLTQIKAGRGRCDSLPGRILEPSRAEIRTDIHLARRIGEALRRAFRSELEMHLDDEGYFVRVDWRPPS